jgi:hypothetical protein
MTTRLGEAELKPGDVLLMQGTALISKLICTFDQGRYSHAALYDGKNVVEMVSPGTTVRSLSESIADARFVDVYRYVSDDGRLLGSPGLDPAPLLKRIEWYEGQRERYGYEQIFLLAVLSATRSGAQGKLSPAMARILRHILDTAADKMAELIHAGKKPMICSELVYRCFTEAEPPYAIHVRGADAPRVAAAGLPGAETAGGEEQAFHREAASFLLNYAIAKGHNIATRGFPAAAVPADVVAASAVADFVTPHDLETSPNLQLVGSLV